VAARAPVAATLAALAEGVLGAPLPVRLRAWDGSEAGPDGAPVGVLRNRRALRHLLWSPNELGLARAYVTGDLDVEGEGLGGGVDRALSLFWRMNAAGAKPRLSLRDKAGLVRSAARLGVLGPRPPIPRAEARLRGEEHSKARDEAAISHHYDFSNAFYRMVLDPQMAYSCGYWTSDAPDYTVEDAQRDKLDLVCAKLGLEPGMRMLDVGCGWGSLAIHAARHFGVHVTGITLAREQREFILARLDELGLADRVDIRLQDYRDLADEPFDAIGTLEMGEHVGRANYPVYAATLHRMLKPGGRLLLQQMSRGATAQGGGAFIETYIAPDMNMRPVGQTVDLLERAGLEVRDVEGLREHYVWTVRAWWETLEARWDEVVALVGVEQARVWRLYFAGGALAFEEGRMGVDQILAVRPTATGRSGMPRTRAELLNRKAHT
jgi:cyclopropane-fatty-acyl-phospholipid synthase